MATIIKHNRRLGDLRPNPELWKGLDEGRLLRQALDLFYPRVFADERLAPFFKDGTVDHVAGKQFSFLQDKIAGTKMYFGARPRNAHHWMVISDELFDYREELLATCLREVGIPEEHVREIREIDEVFRKQIVKSKAVPMKLAGKALPLEGYGAVELSVGGVCDACEGLMEVGWTAHYHVRTGKTMCDACFQQSSGGAETAESFG